MFHVARWIYGRPKAIHRPCFTCRNVPQLIILRVLRDKVHPAKQGAWPVVFCVSKRTSSNNSTCFTCQKAPWEARRAAPVVFYVSKRPSKHNHTYFTYESEPCHVWNYHWNPTFFVFSKGRVSRGFVKTTPRIHRVLRGPVKAPLTNTWFSTPFVWKHA